MDEMGLRDKITELLPKTSLFGGVDTEEIDTFARTLTERSYGAGEDIFQEGGSPGDSYLLLEGDIKLTVSGRRVAKFGPGTVFGVAAPIGIQKQVVTATADSEVVVATFYLLSEENPKLFGKLILNVARDLARAVSGMKEIIQDFILLEEGSFDESGEV